MANPILSPFMSGITQGISVGLDWRRQKQSEAQQKEDNAFRRESERTRSNEFQQNFGLNNSKFNEDVRQFGLNYDRLVGNDKESIRQFDLRQGLDTRQQDYAEKQGDRNYVIARNTANSTNAARDLQTNIARGEVNAAGGYDDLGAFSLGERATAKRAADTNIAWRQQMIDAQDDATRRDAGLRGSAQTLLRAMLSPTVDTLVSKYENGEPLTPEEANTLQQVAMAPELVMRIGQKVPGAKAKANPSFIAAFEKQYGKPDKDGKYTVGGKKVSIDDIDFTTTEAPTVQIGADSRNNGQYGAQFSNYTVAIPGMEDKPITYSTYASRDKQPGGDFATFDADGLATRMSGLAELARDVKAIKASRPELNDQEVVEEVIKSMPQDELVQLMGLSGPQTKLPAEAYQRMKARDQYLSSLRANKQVPSSEVMTQLDNWVLNGGQFPASAATTSSSSSLGGLSDEEVDAQLANMGF